MEDPAQLLRSLEQLGLVASLATKGRPEMSVNLEAEGGTALQVLALFPEEEEAQAVAVGRAGLAA